MKQYKLTDWLPTTKKEIELRGWEELDVILFSGDAYVDHPSFGAAVIGRILEAEGLRIALVPQPNWRDDLRDFKKLGRPRLFFGITAGCMDSMVNRYTANKRLRSNDAYTPDGRTDMRPEYPSIIYTQILKQLFPDVPVILGGIEASMRRLTHYDYWQDRLRPSILVDSGADILVYGMGEKPIIELARRIAPGTSASNLLPRIADVPQVAYLSHHTQPLQDDIWLYSHEECLQDKKKQASNFRHIEEESNKYTACRILQQTGERTVVVNPPYPPMTEEELDHSYDLPYTRLDLCKKCKRPSCIHPAICPNLNTDHRALLDIYRSVDALPGIKKSFIGSGVRYDLLLHHSKDEQINKAAQEYTRQLIVNHVSGRLKVAPEHTSERVLHIMRKPSFSLFKSFKNIFDHINRESGLNQQLIPYFISSHPGCHEEDMAELAAITKQLDFHLEQVQDFTPTPMTVSTETWYTGFHPYTLEPVFSAKTQREKLAQRQFFFWYKTEERRNIINELRRLKRPDLIDKLYGKGKR